MYRDYLALLRTARVAYEQVTVWLPIKNETRRLNYRLALFGNHGWTRVASPSFSHSHPLIPPPVSLASLSSPSSHLLIPTFSVSLHLPRLTAIRHWPCSLCLLPMPQVRPSPNYFLWFMVVGHCHPPKVFTAEITHTVFSNQTHLHANIILPEALAEVGLIITPDIP